MISRLVTAVRNSAGNLSLISWELNPDGTFTRLGDSGSQGGGVDIVTIVATGLDNRTLVTAVRNSSGELELNSWNVSADGTGIRLQPRTRTALGGSVGEIATTLVGATDDGVLTAVQDGAGDILLIRWRVSDRGIERMVDSQNQPTGTADDIAISPAGSPATYVVTMRRGSGDLELIAYSVPTIGAILRTGDRTNDGIETALGRGST